MLPPWEEPLHTTTFASHKPEHQLTPEDKKKICKYIDTLSHRAEITPYFTDGSVDPNTCLASCAFVTNDATYPFHLTDGASRLQAELVGNMKALQHPSQRDGEHIRIFTDSLGAAMLLQHNEHSGNINIISED